MLWNGYPKDTITAQLKIYRQLLKVILRTKTLDMAMNFFSCCNKSGKTQQHKHCMPTFDIKFPEKTCRYCSQQGLVIKLNINEYTH